MVPPCKQCHDPNVHSKLMERALVFEESHKRVSLKELKEEATNSPRFAARPFHILPIQIKNDLWKFVHSQCVIKHEVVSRLLVYLVALVEASIRRITVEFFAMRQS